MLAVEITSSSCSSDHQFTVFVETQGGDTRSEVECILLEDVHDAVDHLVDLIKTYHSKNQLAQVMTSSLFQRRQEEAEAVIDSAVAQLQVSCPMYPWFNTS